MTLPIEYVSIIVFYAIIALLIFIYRKKIDIQYKLLFLLRTKKGISFINRLAKYKKFWKTWGIIGIPIGFAGMFFTLYLLLMNLVNMFMMPDTVPGVSFVLPIDVPGVYYVPIGYFIISLATVLLVHEFAHGIVAKANGVDIKAAGVGLLAILPLAFVEPDEKKLNKTSLKAKLSVFAAGPFANVCVAVFSVILLLLVITPAAVAVHNSYVNVSPGIMLVGVEDGTPAQLAGLEEHAIITKFNDITIETTTDFENAMLGVGPGDTLLLETNSGLIEVIPTSQKHNESRAYVGVSFVQNHEFSEKMVAKYGEKINARFSFVMSFFYIISNLFNWIFILNLGIGLINLLPLGPLDGGRMCKEIFDKYLKKPTAGKIFTILSLTALVILVANLFLPYAL